MVDELAGGLRVKLLDFGISRLSGPNAIRTKNLEALGTAPYMSPEQWQGSMTTDHRSDLFSLGVVMYEMLAGDRPPTPALISPPRLDREVPGLDGRLAALVEQLLALEPASRPATADEVVERIDGLLRPQPRRPRWLVPAVVGVSAIGVALAVAVIARHHGRAASPRGAMAASATAPAAVITTPVNVGFAVDAGPEGAVVAGAGRARRCPGGMVEIVGATFAMGSSAKGAEVYERPRPRGDRVVTLTAYCLDTTEVTVAAYAACVAAQGCTPAEPTIADPALKRADRKRLDDAGLCNGDRDDRRDHPVNCVTWDQARVFCNHVGKRLPSEAQWELAARGPDRVDRPRGRTYPWGDEVPSKERLNACGSECRDLKDRLNVSDWDKKKVMFDESDGYAATAPVGTFTAGATPNGVLDLAGNVWEWVDDGKPLVTRWVSRPTSWAWRASSPKSGWSSGSPPQIDRPMKPARRASV